MANYKSIIILICLIAWLVNSTSHRRKSSTTKKIYRTGEDIAVDDLIQKFEREHQKFYEEEIKEGNHLDWPVLDNKNLSNYCQKYLQQVAPTRETSNASGIKIRRMLHYEKVNTSIISQITIVQCKVKNILPPSFSYYMTRASEPNCVYALKCSGTKASFQFTIINKHCGFEDKPLIIKSIKWKRTEIVDRRDRRTGQPIAKAQYLFQYELEHHEMVKMLRMEGECIEWLEILLHPNLDSYCYQYIRECAPGRVREDITGTWKTEKLNYQKLDTNLEIDVTVITCLIPSVSKRLYHITKAPETNCVYSLVRKINRHVMVIIFKHCDFQDLNDLQTITRDHNILNKNVIPKTQMNEEMSDNLETLQFPKG